MESCSLPLATVTSTSKKHSYVLHDELECLLQSDSEQILLDSDLDTENELEDHAVLDTVRNEVNNEDDNATQAFIRENMENVSDKGKISWAVLDLKVLQKVLWKLWTFLNCFSARN
jgi:hypothetical protein